MKILFPKKKQQNMHENPIPQFPPEFSWLMIENSLKLIFDGLKGDLFKPEAPPENWVSWFAFHPKNTQQNGGKLHWI